MMIKAGIAFTSNNAGAHLVVIAGGKTIDFWPSTGLWQVRGKAQKSRGVVFLVKAVQFLKKEGKF